MRVALLTCSPRPPGGVVHTVALAEALVRLGVEVDVWSLARGGDTGVHRPVDPAVGVRLVPLPDVDGEEVDARVARSIALFRAAFRSASYDVVHAQDCISANAVDRPLRTVHQLAAFTAPHLIAFHAHALRDPVGHLALSEATARQLADEWGIDARVVPHGVDAARFAAAAADEPEAAVARWRWSHRFGRYVLAVGGTGSRRGILDLVAAMGVLRRTRPDVRLVLARGETGSGHTGHRPELDEVAARLGVGIELLDRVPDGQFPSLLAGAAAFVVPGSADGSATAGIEALAADVPLVCRDLPVLRELFGASGRFAGTPAGTAAALEAALTVPDPERRAAGRRTAAGHSWERAALAHLAFYRAYLRSCS